MAVFVLSCHLPSDPFAPGEEAEAETTAKPRATSRPVLSTNSRGVGNGIRGPAPVSWCSEASSSDAGRTFVEPQTDDASLCWALGCLGQVLGRCGCDCQTTLPRVCWPWATEVVSGHTRAKGRVASTPGSAPGPAGGAYRRHASVPSPRS